MNKYFYLSLSLLLSFAMAVIGADQIVISGLPNESSALKKGFTSNVQIGLETEKDIISYSVNVVLSSGVTTATLKYERGTDLELFYKPNPVVDAETLKKPGTSFKCLAASLSKESLGNSGALISFDMTLPPQYSSTTFTANITVDAVTKDQQPLSQTVSKNFSVVNGENYLKIASMESTVYDRDTILYLPVYLFNDFSVKSFLFDVILPEGLSIECDKIKSLRVSKVTACSQVAANTYRVLYANLNNTSIAGNSGDALVELPIKVNKNIQGGKYTIGLVKQQLGYIGVEVENLPNVTQEILVNRFIQVLAQVENPSLGIITGAKDYKIEGVKSAHIEMTATPNKGATFAGWEEVTNPKVLPADLDLTKDTLIFDAKASVSLKAKFAKSLLTVGATVATEKSGSVEGGGEFPFGTKVVLKAIPATGYQFVKWTDAAGKEIAGAGAEYTFNLAADMALVAVFEKQTYAIKTIAPTEGGTISESKDYLFGEEISIAATPASGWYFAGWKIGGVMSDNKTNPLVFTAEKSLTIEAVFTKELYTIACQFDKAMGEVIGAKEYPFMSEVELKAVPNAGFNFVGWYEGEKLITNQPIYKFTAEKSLQLSAKFENILYTVTVQSNNTEYGTVSASLQGIKYNAAVALKATPKIGILFLGWQKDNAETLIEGAEATVVITDTVTYTAIFKPIPGDVTGSGEISVNDVVAVVSHIMEEPLEAFRFEAADLNGDGIVDIMDIVLLIDIVLGNDNQATTLSMLPLTADVTLKAKTLSVDASSPVLAFDFAYTGSIQPLDAASQYVIHTYVKNGKQRVLGYTMGSGVSAGELFSVTGNASDFALVGVKGTPFEVTEDIIAGEDLISDAGIVVAVSDKVITVVGEDILAIEVSDISGRTLATTTEKVISMQSFASDVVIVKVKTSTSIVTKKVVLK